MKKHDAVPTTEEECSLFFPENNMQIPGNTGKKAHNIEDILHSKEKGVCYTELELCAPYTEDLTYTMFSTLYSKNTQNFISTENIKELSTHLENKDCPLVVLSISMFSISNEDIPTLANALAKNRSLRELCLKGNTLNSSATSLLIQAVTNNTRLISLTLAYNTLSADNILLLAYCLDKNKDLLSLNISHILPYTRQAQQLPQALEKLSTSMANHSNLISVDLSGNNFSDPTAPLPPTLSLFSITTLNFFPPFTNLLKSLLNAFKQNPNIIYTGPVEETDPSLYNQARLNYQKISQLTNKLLELTNLKENNKDTKPFCQSLLIDLWMMYEPSISHQLLITHKKTPEEVEKLFEKVRAIQSQTSIMSRMGIAKFNSPSFSSSLKLNDLPIELLQKIEEHLPLPYWQNLLQQQKQPNLQQKEAIDNILLW